MQFGADPFSIPDAAQQQVSAALNERMISGAPILPPLPKGALNAGPDALAGALGKALCRPGELSDLRRRFWRSSLREAHIAWHVANQRQMAADTIFTLGLLHRLGRVAVVHAMEFVLAEGLDLDPKPADFWLRLVDLHHVEFGLPLAREWELPSQHCELLALTLPELSEQDAPAASLLRIAEEVECALDLAHQLPQEQLSTFDAPTRAAIERATGELPALLARFSHDATLPGDSWAVMCTDDLNPAHPSGQKERALPPMAVFELAPDLPPPADARPTGPSESVDAQARVRPAKEDFARRPWVQIALLTALVLFIVIRLGIWWLADGGTLSKTADTYITRSASGVVTERRRAASAADIEEGRPAMVMVELFRNATGGLTVDAVGADPDGDAVQYQYRWFRDGRHLEIDGNVVDSSQLAAGSYAVSVRATDGSLTSLALRSPPLVVK